MSAEDRIERATRLHERAVYAGDTSVLSDAERDLDAVDADAALARGRILHARFVGRAGQPQPGRWRPAAAGNSPVASD